MRIKISIRKLITWLAIITLVLNGIGFVGRAVEHFLGYKETTEFVRLFHPAEEANITSWFSSLLLLFSAILLAIIAREKKTYDDPYRRHWFFLSLIFFYISLDEAAAIHEISIKPLRSLFGADGIFYFSWVIIAIPILLLLALLYFRFVFALPRSTCYEFILAGSIYIMGALGMEMLGGYFIHKKVLGIDIYPFEITIEELLENIGIVIFIYSLTSYISSQLEPKKISIEFF